MDDTNRITIIAGQWCGHFIYGPEYGPNLVGEQVVFSLLIDNVFNNQFKGKCIELEGIGASTEVSTIEVFLDKEFISFKKEYPTDSSIDKYGNECAYEGTGSPRLSYIGQIHRETNTFTGTWEISTNHEKYGL